MTAIIWWIGAVHMVVYAVAGTAAVTWWATEFILRRLGLVRPLIRFLVDRAKRDGRPG